MLRFWCPHKHTVVVTKCECVRACVYVRLWESASERERVFGKHRSHVYSCSHCYIMHGFQWSPYAGHEVIQSCRPSEIVSQPPDMIKAQSWLEVKSSPGLPGLSIDVNLTFTSYANHTNSHSSLSRSHAHANARTHARTHTRTHPITRSR